ncbi:hypothetical protein Ocin01_07682 [Orchesella cincta]|uniref:Uncharacterized protein n=1 Tax=Orchesella cincta TaxID=48709 RepID=A0A1D2N1B8_ORCCI|nr:hypothetical protein Ocin01_07682 [Orchesella cincta]
MGGLQQDMGGEVDRIFVDRITNVQVVYSVAKDCVKLPHILDKRKHYQHIYIFATYLQSK